MGKLKIGVESPPAPPTPQKSYISTEWNRYGFDLLVFYDLRQQCDVAAQKAKQSH